MNRTTIRWAVPALAASAAVAAIAAPAALGFFTFPNDRLASVSGSREVTQVFTPAPGAPGAKEIAHDQFSHIKVLGGGRLNSSGGVLARLGGKISGNQGFSDGTSCKWSLSAKPERPQINMSLIGNGSHWSDTMWLGYAESSKLASALKTACSGPSATSDESYLIMGSSIEPALDASNEPLHVTSKLPPNWAGKRSFSVTYRENKTISTTEAGVGTTTTTYHAVLKFTFKRVA